MALNKTDGVGFSCTNYANYITPKLDLNFIQKLQWMDEDYPRFGDSYFFLFQY